MKNMAFVSPSAWYREMSRKQDARDLSSPQPPRVSFCASFHDLCKFGTLNRRKNQWLLHAQRKPNCKKGKTREPILLSHLACARLSVIADERKKGESSKKANQRKTVWRRLSPAPTRFLHFVFITITEPGTGYFTLYLHILTLPL